MFSNSASHPTYKVNIKPSSTTSSGAVPLVLFPSANSASMCANDRAVQSDPIRQVMWRHGCRWFGRSQLDRLFVCVFARRFSRGRVKSTARFCGYLLCRGSEVSRCLSVFNAFTISRQKVICWAIPILRVGFNGTHQACSLNACSLEICFGQKIPLMQPYIKTTSSSRISFILSDCISNTAAAPSR